MFTLRRQTSGRAYVPEIDGLRFIAILSVVLFHIAIQVTDQPNGIAVAQALSPFVHNGYRGVELFFVISGFILGLPFARHRLTGAPMMRLRDYFLRRVTRLEPPYFAIMLLRAGLIIGVLHRPARVVLLHLLASLGYVHSLVYGTFNPLNPPVWSLEMEIQFYCLAPVFAWLLFSIRKTTWLRRGLMLVLIVAAGIIQLHMNPGGRAALSILYSVQYFLAGFLLCDFYLVGWEHIPSHLLWDLVCVPLWVWVFWWDSEWYHVWLPVACLVLYIGAFKGPAQRTFFRHPVIATTGGMCYSIYLTHNLVLTLATGLFHHFRHSLFVFASISLLIVLMVFTVGLLFYILLERPCMERDWPQRLAALLLHRPPAARQLS